MRGTTRVFAAVRGAPKFLEPHTPTGLTGLSTHPAPRPALIYNYRETLRRLKQIPSTSVYRQSVEALTNHRLKIIEDVKPEGYDQWLERVKQQIEKLPGAYDKYKNSDGSIASSKLYEDRAIPWDGNVSKADARGEGSNSMAEAQRKGQLIQSEVDEVNREAERGVLPTIEDLEQEPPLTIDQINDIETKMGAGLIEEVIQVSEGELELVNVMLEHQVWEPLEEEAPSRQWEYFERGDRV